MTEFRTIPCEDCMGDGGFVDNGDGRWIKCPLCDGDGEYEVAIHPIEIDDLAAELEEELETVALNANKQP